MPPQRPNARPPRLDHDEITLQPVRLDSNNIHDRLGLFRGRKAVQLQHNEASNAAALTNDHLAKIVVFRDQTATLDIGKIENKRIGRTRASFGNRLDLETSRSESFDNEGRHVLIGQEVHSPAAITVSCCI